jgi:hypothetical protein
LGPPEGGGTVFFLTGFRGGAFLIGGSGFLGPFFLVGGAFFLTGGAFFIGFAGADFFAGAFFAAFLAVANSSP